MAPGHLVQLPHRQVRAQALAHAVHHADRARRAVKHFGSRLSEAEGAGRIDVVALVHAREIEQHQFPLAHAAPGRHRVAGIGLRAREHRKHHRRHLSPGRGQGAQDLALHFQLAHSRADDFARAFEPRDRDARRLVQAGHLRRRLLPAHIADDRTAVHDPGPRRLERGLEAIARRPIRAPGPELQPHVARQPSFRLQLLGDESGAVTVGIAREEARVLRDREGAREDRLALGLEVDETVVVHVNRDAVGGWPFHRALGLVPHAQVAADVVEAFRRGEEEAVDSRLGHRGANALQTSRELLLAEWHFGFGRGVEVHLVSVAHGVLRGRAARTGAGQLSMRVPAPPARARARARQAMAVS